MNAWLTVCQCKTIQLIQYDVFESTLRCSHLLTNWMWYEIRTRQFWQIYILQLTNWRFIECLFFVFFFCTRTCILPTHFIYFTQWKFNFANTLLNQAPSLGIQQSIWIVHAFQIFSRGSIYRNHGNIQRVQSTKVGDLMSPTSYVHSIASIWN